MIDAANAERRYVAAVNSRLEARKAAVKAAAFAKRLAESAGGGVRHASNMWRARRDPAAGSEPEKPKLIHPKSRQNAASGTPLSPSRADSLRGPANPAAPLVWPSDGTPVIIRPPPARPSSASNKVGCVCL